MNRLIHGDNAEVMRALSGESIDLIYLDPPFNTGLSFTTKSGELAYEDRWEGGDYLDMLRPRIEMMHGLLKDTGSIFLHCDWRASAHLRLMLDTIFGIDNFQNEIIWKRAPDGIGASTKSKRFGRNYDSILWYSKSAVWTYNMQHTKLSEKQIKTYGKRDVSGRMFKEVRVDGYTEKSIRSLEAQGLIYITKTGIKRKKYFLDEATSKVGVIWDDLLGFQAASLSADRVDYPTQKPEKLLARVIKTASNAGDVVADFFCGSGTTPVVAEKLGRRWIACDAGDIAIETATKRLLAIDATFATNCKST